MYSPHCGDQIGSWMSQGVQPALDVVDCGRGGMSTVVTGMVTLSGWLGTVKGCPTALAAAGIGGAHVGVTLKIVARFEAQCRYLM